MAYLLRPAVFLFVGSLFVSCQSGPDAQALLDDTQVTRLLDVLDTLAVRNPGYQEAVAELETFPPAERVAQVAARRARNEDDADLQAQIGSLLQIEPYRIYFDRFHNITPADIRLALNTIPYGAADLPGGAGDALYELFLNKDLFRKWYESSRGGIDIYSALVRARVWLPRGARPATHVFMIYDGNAGSFAEQGSAFFNLCSELITKSPKEQRFRNLGAIDPESLEQVIAHELHHVMSEPFLFPEEDGTLSWQKRWNDRIVRTLVSEGVAFRCNPLKGIQKEVWEDSVTIAVLIRNLNETVKAMDAGRVSEDSVAAWYRGLYHEYAMKLLEGYFSRTRPDQDAHALAREYAIFRPDLPHTLGWWMVSVVTEHGAEEGPAIDLILHPRSLFSRYNETLPSGMTNLAVDARVVEGAESLH